MAPAEASASSSSSTKNGSTNKEEQQKNAFAQHAAADSALQAPPPSPPSNGQQQQPQQQQQQPESGGLTFGGRLAVFLLFPTAAGALGLYLAWLETRRQQSQKQQLSLDRDFCVPFLLALALAGVVGVQTGGFRARRAAPLIAWPRVKRVQKVVVVKKKKKKKQEQPIKEE